MKSKKLKFYNKMMDVQIPNTQFSTWNLTKRINFMKNKLFKLKQINNNQFLLHVPSQNIVQRFDINLNPLMINYKFTQQVHALQYFKEQEHEHIICGLPQGSIQVQNVTNKKISILQLQQKKSPHVAMINEILYLGNYKIVNCFNDGSLCFWDISPQKLSSQINTMNKVHQRYTYKLKKINDYHLVSCGSDNTAKIIDLNRSKIINVLNHQNAVWCANPISQNLLASVGLFQKVMFWDLRSYKPILFCRFKNGNMSESSYVTKFDKNSIICGENKNLVKVDIRKMEYQYFSHDTMKTSVQSLIVGENVVAVGRGGDLCLFTKQQRQLEQKWTKKSVNELTTENLHHLQFMNILNLHPLMHQILPLLNQQGMNHNIQLQMNEGQEQFDDEEYQQIDFEDIDEDMDDQDMYEDEEQF